MNLANMMSAAALIGLVFSAQQAHAWTPEQQEIRKLIEVTYPQNAKSGDAKKYAGMYTKNALWMPPGGKDRRGPGEIEEGYSDMIHRSSFAPVLTALEITLTSSETALVVGNADVTLEPRNGSEAQKMNLRVLWLVQKESGEWKIGHQIWHPKK